MNLAKTHEEPPKKISVAAHPKPKGAWKKSALNGLVNFAEGVGKTAPITAGAGAGAVAVDAGAVAGALAWAAGASASAGVAGAGVGVGAGVLAWTAVGVGAVGALAWAAKKIQITQHYMDYKPVKPLQRLGMAFGLAAPLSLGGWTGMETFQYLDGALKKEQAEKAAAAAKAATQIPQATYDVTGKPGTACDLKVVFEGADGTQFLLPKGCEMKRTQAGTAPRPGE